MSVKTLRIQVEDRALLTAERRGAMEAAGKVTWDGDVCVLPVDDATAVLTASGLELGGYKPRAGDASALVAMLRAKNSPPKPKVRLRG